MATMAEFLQAERDLANWHDGLTGDEAEQDAARAEFKVRLEALLALGSRVTDPDEEYADAMQEIRQELFYV